MSNLDRFLKAQESVYQTALSEIQAGKKTSHWIWYIFPQLKGLGHSSNCEHYGIESMEEAFNYVNHPMLGVRLKEITTALLNQHPSNIIGIVGFIDAQKIQSSMTLFELVASEPDKELFSAIIRVFYNDKRCLYTLNKVDTIPL